MPGESCSGEARAVASARRVSAGICRWPGCRRLRAFSRPAALLALLRKRFTIHLIVAQLLTARLVKERKPASRPQAEFKMPFTRFDRYVDRHARSFTERLQSLCRMPSVAARGTGMRAMAEAVEQLMQNAGAGTRAFKIGN